MPIPPSETLHFHRSSTTQPGSIHHASGRGCRSRWQLRGDSGGPSPDPSLSPHPRGRAPAEHPQPWSPLPPPSRVPAVIEVAATSAPIYSIRARRGAITPQTITLMPRSVTSQLDLAIPAQAARKQGRENTSDQNTYLLLHILSHFPAPIWESDKV